ncbi:hypothetical protein K8942_01625 [Candidatus Peribacteria bacterium]|nr:MAG: hypothetical protein K8942_01625 [Candidatus Peribacteria bacterium]
MGTTLFASTGVSILSTVIIVLECLSLLVLCIGLLSYRHIIVSHRAFFSSLQNGGKQAGRESFGILFWLYVLSTLFLVVLTSVIYVRLLTLS